MFSCFVYPIAVPSSLHPFNHFPQGLTILVSVYFEWWCSYSKFKGHFLIALSSTWASCLFFFFFNKIKGYLWFYWNYLNSWNLILLNHWANFIHILASALVRDTNICRHTCKAVLTVFHQLVKYFLSYTENINILILHNVMESLSVHESAQEGKCSRVYALNEIKM